MNIGRIRIILYSISIAVMIFYGFGFATSCMMGAIGGMSNMMKHSVTTDKANTDNSTNKNPDKGSHNH
ncbi:MAG: hypothetical protein H7844_03105 [Nitrospirae bacterium YQR-1]